MKNKKISIGTIVIIVLIVIIISMFFIILNMRNKNIEKQITDKEQLTEITNDNAYVTMADHFSEVNSTNSGIYIPLLKTTTSGYNATESGGYGTLELAELYNYTTLTIAEMSITKKYGKIIITGYDDKDNETTIYTKSGTSTVTNTSYDITNYVKIKIEYKAYNVSSSTTEVAPTTLTDIRIF